VIKDAAHLLACLTMIVATVAIAPAQRAAAAGQALRDGSHDMDFSVGKWRTAITSFKDPFNHPELASHMSGTKTARPVWNGKAFLEEIEADGPSGHWEAANLFLYDPAAHQWSQNYVDSSDGRLDAAPGIGEYRDGNLEFYWQAKIGGRAMLVRGIWTDFTPTSHTYRVERSNDGGRSWHPSFIARVTKIK
jgi:hypothetical protein